MIFWPLLLLVLLVPLPFAAVQTGAWSFLGLLVGAIWLLWGLRVAQGRAPVAVGLARIWPAVLLFGLALLWGFLQASPLLPEAWHHPLWQRTAEILGGDVAGRVSLDPADSHATLLRLLTYGGVFWLALQIGRDSALAAKAYLALTLAGLVYAAYGLAILFSGANLVLWFDKTSYLNVVTSTFVNRNSYATYAGLGLICATGLAVRFFSNHVGGAGSLFERLYRNLEPVIARGWSLLLAWPMLLTAVLLTQSRGGFLATLLGFLAFLGATGARRSAGLARTVTIAVPFLLAVIALVQFSGDATVSRLVSDREFEGGRGDVYALTLEAIAARPLLGTGLGTFESAFRQVRGSDIKSRYKRAHSTFLEGVLELGLPAALFLFGSIGFLFLRCLIGVRVRQRDTVFPAIGVGATVLVAAHSIVDFSLQIPAVAVTYAFIMGIAVAQSWPRSWPRA